VDRGRWVAALAEGARQAGHSRSAESLVDGSLVEVDFAYYGDLFQRAQEQGAGFTDLSKDEAVLLNELLTEIVEAHYSAPDRLPGAALVHALAQLRPSGDAQGAGDLVRRAINVSTTLLGAGPWGGAGQWAGGKLLVRDLAQVARYLARGEPDRDGRSLDERIRDVLAEALGPGPQHHVLKLCRFA
jgi:hypothetical protein